MAADMAEYLGITKKSVSNYIREYGDEYEQINGIVFRKAAGEEE